MSEFSIVLLSVLGCVALFIIYKIIMSGKQVKGKIDLKNKTIEMHNINDTVNKENSIVDNSFIEAKELIKLKDKDNKQILEYYKKTDYNDDITKLIVYIEYSKIISRTIIDVFSLVISYIAKNHILSKDKNEFNIYVKEKRIIIIDMFNVALSKSSIDSIKKLSIDKVCNLYYIIVLDNIKDMYESIYDNHLIQADKRKKFLNNLKNIDAKDRFKSYDLFIRNNHTETTIKDAEIVKEHTEYLLTFLLGLFHDMIEKEYKYAYK